MEGCTCTQLNKRGGEGREADEGSEGERVPLVKK